jgi:hypothetical protein
VNLAAGSDCAAPLAPLDIVAMLRRVALLPLLLAACSTTEPGEPSLAPRAAEAVDPRVPIPSDVIAGPADPALAASIADLLNQVRSGDAAFQANAADAERLAAAAGPPESESWIAAQEALSALIAARAPVAKAVADLDGLASSRLAASGGILPGDLAAIQAAADEAGAVGEREAATIQRLQAMLLR